MKIWEYCWLHWSTAEIIYLTEEGELREFPAQKDAGTAIANLGLAGWELVNVERDMWYFKREKTPEVADSY